MEEQYYTTFSDIEEKTFEKYRGKSAWWLCDKLARLSENYIITRSKNDLDRIIGCSVAFMKRLRKLSDCELYMLQEYVGEMLEYGNRSYITASNVFALKKMFEL